MALNMNILDTYYMMGLWKGLSPAPTFFRDRYFPTDAADIFAADKVLVEVQKGDTQMAPFMVERAEPIKVDRLPYEIHDYAPTKIAQKRELSIDELKTRGFGEAILTDSTEEERAAKLVSQDLEDLERRITRAEEWLCAQTIANNGFSVDEMIDKDHKGNTATVQYYDPLEGNAGAYTCSLKWDANGATYETVASDIRAICRSMSERGVASSDLLLGVNVADVLVGMQEFRDMINKQSGLIISTGIEAELTKYVGVTLLGVVNFWGHRLNLIVVDEQYTNASNQQVAYFDKKHIAVTAPRAGRLMYAHINHMDENGNVVTITGKRVPDLFVDRRHKTRELILETRPLAAPRTYAPWVYSQALT